MPSYSKNFKKMPKTFRFDPEKKTIDKVPLNPECVDFDEKTCNVHFSLRSSQLSSFCKKNGLNLLHRPHLTVCIIEFNEKFVRFLPEILKRIRFIFDAEIKTSGKTKFVGKSKHGKSKIALLFDPIGDGKEQITQMRTMIHQQVGKTFAEWLDVPLVYRKVRHERKHIHIGLVNEKTDEVIYSTRMMHFGVCKWMPHLTLVDRDFKLETTTIQMKNPTLKFSVHTKQKRIDIEIQGNQCRENIFCKKHRRNVCWNTWKDCQWKHGCRFCHCNHW